MVNIKWVKCSSVKRYDSEYDLMFDFDILTELQKVVLETGDFNSSYQW